MNKFVLAVVHILSPLCSAPLLLTVDTLCEEGCGRSDSCPGYSLRDRLLLHSLGKSCYLPFLRSFFSFLWQTALVTHLLIPMCTFSSRDEFTARALCQISPLHATPDLLSLHRIGKRGPCRFMHGQLTSSFKASSVWWVSPDSLTSGRCGKWSSALV